MGFFNYVETIFLISLGITFGLILLLIYHFKDRIVTTERKNDTMFEIINHMVAELTTLKSQIFSQCAFPFCGKSEVNVDVKPDVKPEVTRSKIQVSDNESDESEDEEDDEEDEEDEEDEDDESELVNCIIEITEIEPKLDDAISIVVSDPISEVSDEIIEVNDPISEVNDPISEVNDPISEVSDEIIEVNDPISEVNEVSEVSEVSEDELDIYRKMNLQSLKQVVITKGICADPSKFKKPHLISLLSQRLA